MKLLTIYDITDNRLRNRVSRKCKDFGLARVQKSCFAGDLSQNRMEMLIIELKRLLEDQVRSEACSTDAIYVLPMCETCFPKKVLLGYQMRFPDKKKERLKVI